MAKIAVELEQALAQRAVNGARGEAKPRVLAQGNGWSVEDVVCTFGPQDRAFEEQHANVAIAMVVAGSFQYRSARGRELMTPGSLLLGNAGQPFECSHDHGAGDRCLAFHYAPDYFENLAADAGTRGKLDFQTLRLPTVRALSPLVARCCAGLAGASDVPWEELGVLVAQQTLRLVGGLRSGSNSAPPSAVARVTRTAREIERRPDARLTLGAMAQEAGLSPYHFLRTFERVTGQTPYRYLRRSRLRQAAMRLVLEPARVLDIALDCGFGDLSNFNHAFRAEFGVSPRAFRSKAHGGWRA